MKELAEARVAERVYAEDKERRKAATRRDKGEHSAVVVVLPQSSAAVSRKGPHLPTGGTPNRPDGNRESGEGGHGNKAVGRGRKTKHNKYHGGGECISRENGGSGDGP